MVGTLQPLDQKFLVVNKDGTPTDYFTRWAQQRQIDIGEGISLADMQAYLATIDVIAGVGLTGGGPLSGDVTLTANAEAILNTIGATQGNILYKSGTVWNVLAPGTAGQVLSTGGAGADPSWITPSSGASSFLHVNATPADIPGGVTTEQVLMTYTLPASTLTNIGDTIYIEGLSTWITTGGTKTSRVHFGAISSGLAAATSNQQVDQSLRVVKTGSNTQLVTATSRVWTGPVGTAGALTAASSFNTINLTTETDTAGIVIKITGQVSSAAAAAITARYLSVRKVSA
jgi:hypothetical protein